MSKRMVDCIDLIANEIGFENLGAAMKFVDEILDNAWSLHIDEIEEMVNDPRYLSDPEYRLQVASEHFDVTKDFISVYKRSSKRFDERQSALFNLLQ